MTKNILSTNLNEIDGIKFVCRKCNANFLVPLNKNNLPESCFSCGNKLNRKEMEELINSFKRLIQLSDAHEFDLIIEIEQK